MTLLHRVKPGMRITVDERDYLYGTGTVVLDVTEVGEAANIDGTYWVRVSGMQVFQFGVTVARTMQVRLDAGRGS